ncbi:glycosyltransferase family 2 protein [Heminiphilus faecis]|uniref:Glycosyltransferase family 2 protein n=1 Tax=Heminiphilus faecis TaxID=2601703 RepID=A0ABV4CRU0_9BACT
MNNLKITVVTICYNALDTIESTMLSVFDQTYDNIEYIIIDGGSTDGTVDIIKKYADRLTYWVSEPDRGIYDAMNKGIAAATGDYINFMNAGDKFARTDVIAQICDSVEKKTDIVYGDYYILNDKKSKYPIYTKPQTISKVISKVISKSPICHQATFTRTEYLKTYPFDLKFKICADWNSFRKGFLEDGLVFQYVALPICYFDSNAGMSHDNLDLLYKERYMGLGIEHKFFHKLPHEIIRYGVHLKRHLLRLLH